MSKRNPDALGIWGKKGTRPIASDRYWAQLDRWNEAAARSGERRRVFCASMADLFEGPDSMPAEDWPNVQNARRRLFEKIATTPALDYLVLTKRPQNVMQLVPDRWRDSFPPNVWLGTSVEDQKTAILRIPELLEVPAAIHYLSCEPFLGSIDLRPWLHGAGSNRIDWVIAGGESGPGARPMDESWVRSLRDQCMAWGVPFLFKQWGGVRKHTTGRELDGRTWDEFPAIRKEARDRAA